MPLKVYIFVVQTLLAYFLRLCYTKAMKNDTKQNSGSCDSCTYYVYDEDCESYVCDMDMDEDEYMRLVTDKQYSCPYYRNGDEYLVVRHQM